MVDAQSHLVLKRISFEGPNVRPMGAVSSPDGRAVYVTTGRGRTVVAIDAQNATPSWSVEVGERPWGIAVTSDGRTLYTANGPSNDVSVVDVATRAVTARIAVGQSPWGVAILP
jgi:YVTN family beta-propeller protein